VQRTRVHSTQGVCRGDSALLPNLVASSGSQRAIGRVTLVAFATLVLVIATVGCSPAKRDSQDFTSHTAAPEHDTGAPVVVAAGDIAICYGTGGDEATSRLLGDIEGTVLTLGDNAYQDGTPEEFADCYGPSWGLHKNRTKPSPGNHDYHSEGAEGYFGYFGEAAGESAKGYYSFDLGAWHVVALNSNCEYVGGCGAGSAQVRWLANDLRRNQAVCTLAYWHHPLFSSGEKHGSTPEVKPLWETLYEAGADVVLSAHEHNYERFAPQDPDGEVDPERGIREFVVGTGGKSHYPIVDPIANSEIHNDDTYGVLKLELLPKGYDWRFVPVEGERFTDSGSARCH
jgi:acid phosphatase type 7